ncbi:MAG: Mov34/MPN/PAD-1 family protein [Gaiellaceae bacterium]
MKIWIERAALISILREAQASIDGRETGGLLIGFEAEKGVAITEAGKPGPEAVRRRGFFLRDLEFAERLLQDAFLRTGAVWVGDWHTHTVSCDRPSTRDAQSYMNLVNDEELAFDQFIALIVTSRSGTFSDARLAPWTACRQGLRRVDLVL